MKKIIILFIFSFSLSFSQSFEDLKLKTEAYYQASYNIEIDKIIDFTYPKFFDNYSKEQIYTVIEQGFDNEVYKSRLVFPTVIFRFGEIKSLNNTKIVKIEFKNAARITYEKKISQNDSKKIIADIIKNTNFSTVTFEEKRNSFLLAGNFTQIAISDENTNFEWKFLDYSEKQEEMANKLINPDVLNLIKP
jgi:hypothetical protein